MTVLPATFLHFEPPDAPTWFCLSLLLAVALFFKFSRFLSVRNLDVVLLFLLVPGLLLLIDSPENWYGYLWLFIGSGYYLLRCLFDLTLVRRPALAPNLNLSGLAWLAGALFVCLVFVAYRHKETLAERLGKDPAMLVHVENQMQNVVELQAGASETTGFDVSGCVGRTLAVICHLAIIAGLIFVGCRHFQDIHSGMAAATFYLLLPYTAYHIGQWHHVWPMALIVWAVGLYRRPLAAGVLMGLAAGTVYFPVLAFPLWFSFYWRRGAGRFAFGFGVTAAICLAIIGSILWLDGELPRSLQSVLSLSDWQPWREPSPESQGFWTGVHWAWAYRMPVFIAYLAFVAVTACWPSPKNLAHLLALTTAILIGIQFWYADQGGVYVLWYLPLLLLMVFRPNLAERRPPLISGEADWVMWAARGTVRLVSRLLRPPEPVVRVR
jgi:hypothetical protein